MKINKHLIDIIKGIFTKVATVYVIVFLGILYGYRDHLFKEVKVTLLTVILVILLISIYTFIFFNKPKSKKSGTIDYFYRYGGFKWQYTIDSLGEITDIRANPRCEKCNTRLLVTNPSGNKRDIIKHTSCGKCGDEKSMHIDAFSQAKRVIENECSKKIKTTN